MQVDSVNLAIVYFTNETTPACEIKSKMAPWMKAWGPLKEMLQRIGDVAEADLADRAFKMVSRRIDRLNSTHQGDYMSFWQVDNINVRKAEQCYFKGKHEPRDIVKAVSEMYSVIKSVKEEIPMGISAICSNATDAAQRAAHFVAMATTLNNTVLRYLPTAPVLTLNELQALAKTALRRVQELGAWPMPDGQCSAHLVPRASRVELLRKAGYEESQAELKADEHFITVEDSEDSSEEEDAAEGP